MTCSAVVCGGVVVVLCAHNFCVLCLLHGCFFAPKSYPSHKAVGPTTARRRTQSNLLRFFSSFLFLSFEPVLFLSFLSAITRKCFHLYFLEPTLSLAPYCIPLFLHTLPSSFHPSFRHKIALAVLICILVYTCTLPSLQQNYAKKTPSKMACCSLLCTLAIPPAGAAMGARPT